MIGVSFRSWIFRQKPTDGKYGIDVMLPGMV